MRAVALVATSNATPGESHFEEGLAPQTLDTRNVGVPAVVRDGVALPARGVLAIGQATWEILDREEYERTQREVSGPTSPEVR